MLDSDGLFRNRENPPRAKDRNPFSSGFKLVRGVARDNLCFLIFTLTLHIINGHNDLVSVV